MNRFERSVLDVAQTLGVVANGTQEAHEVDVDVLATWLRWRLSDGWRRRLGGTAAVCAYDAAVRSFGWAALALIEQKQSDSEK